jgi:hypothetical protein
VRTLLEHLLLLEYDHDKTWAKYGERVHARMVDDPLNRRDDYPIEKGEDPHRVSDVFHHFLKAGDPTPHQEYSQWITHHYATGGIKSVEDFGGRVHGALSAFHDAKRRGHLKRLGISADINQHKGLGALEDVVDKLPKPEPKDPDRPEPHEYEKHEEEHWTHYTPYTEKAAKYYGRGTRWCTAAKNGCMFNDYNSEGDHLHIMVPKKPIYPGEKYQYHVGSGSFMDMRDEEESHEAVLKDRPSPKFHQDLENGLNNPHTTYGAIELSGTKDLDRFKDHPQMDVRSHVAHNTTSPETLTHLLNDESHSVRGVILFNKHHTLEHERVLSHDPNDYVRANVAFTTNNHEIMDRLMNDPSSVVRGKSLFNPFDRERRLDSYVHDPEFMVKREVIRQGLKSHHMALAHDSDPQIRHQLVANTQHPDVLKHLADHDTDDTISKRAWDRYVDMTHGR